MQHTLKNKRFNSILECKTRVVSLVNSNVELYVYFFLLFRKISVGKGNFSFLIVLVIVIFIFNSIWPKYYDVHKLLQFKLYACKPHGKSKITIKPWFFGQNSWLFPEILLYISQTANDITPKNSEHYTIFSRFESHIFPKMIY